VQTALYLFLSLRPHQWVKNLFVLAPLVFARKLLDPGSHLPNLELIFAAVGAFAVFCLASGAVYLLNDIVDREKDARHPVKKNRPIASGRLSLPAARAGLALVTLAACVTAVLIQPALLTVAAAYMLLNVGYSFRFKHIPFLDVASIAAGFMLRVLGGAVAIEVPVTVWLYACTFLLASYLALGKRKHELLNAGVSASLQRQVLGAYVVRHVDHAQLAAGIATGICYGAYTWSEHAVSQFGTRGLVLTLPFIAFGLWRFARLTNRTDTAESPTEAMIRDLPFLANLGLWAVAVVAIIYAR
jgi:4-hydroxybenzoate polyprenyltransferase